MMKKLLKYDLRAIFKYWWIVALSSLGLSFIGGISLRILTGMPSEIEDGRVFVFLLAVLGMILTVIGISAFLISAEIFVYVRLYKHFFSDEGYLTFTLPVKRRDLLNSKIISGLVVNIATFAVVAVDICIILTIGIDFETIQKIGESFFWFIGSAFETMGALCIAYILEAIVLILCLAVMSYLLVAICITFAAVIAKKYKIFAAIGIYYIASAIVSFVGQFALMFGSMSLAGIFSSIPEGSVLGVGALMLLSISLLVSAICVCLYSLEVHMLEKKLNLS